MVMFIPQTAHSSDEKESSAATIIVLITTNPLRYEIDTFMDEFLSIVGTMYIVGVPVKKTSKLLCSLIIIV